MRQKMITLDETTWKLAETKPNFSDWVRNQLRSERNKSESPSEIKMEKLDGLQLRTKMSSYELLYHLEQCSDDEINALVSILRGSLQ